MRKAQPTGIDNFFWWLASLGMAARSVQALLVGCGIAFVVTKLPDDSYELGMWLASFLSFPLLAYAFTGFGVDERIGNARRGARLRGEATQPSQLLVQPRSVNDAHDARPPTGDPRGDAAERRANRVAKSRARRLRPH